jgi:hypothetical protein
MARREFCQNDAPAMRFDNVASTHIVRPIMPLYENVRQDGLDERPRLVLVKEDDTIDGTKRGKDRRAIALRIDRPARAFDPKHGGIAVQTDNERVALSPRKVEVLNMTAVENIKTAIREDEFSSGCIEPITQLSRFRR